MHIHCGSQEDCPSEATTVKFREWPARYFMVADFGVVSGKSTEPKMQRTFFSSQNSSATVAASVSLWGEAAVAPAASVIS